MAHVTLSVADVSWTKRNSNLASRYSTYDYFDDYALFATWSVSRMFFVWNSGDGKDVPRTTFFKVVSSAIVNKYIGESDRLIREMFN